MKNFGSLKVSLLMALAGLAAALPAAKPLEDRAIKTTIEIPAGTVVGRSLLGVESFGGIPFAEPPTGNLRLRPPVRLNKTLDNFDATGLGPGCPQMFFSTGDQGGFLTQVLGDLLNTGIFQTVTGQTEDCLTISVQRPAGISADAKLPVLFWIFGGGFELGSPQMYDGASLILAGQARKMPFIFVAVNYRVGGFGFMPGKEILADGASNLGLLDQRMGLEWVADNIAAFGGDPDKVTIWGESAGSISVFDQMALYGGDNKYNGKALFRGAIMNSGSMVPADPNDCAKCQVVYDTVVKEAGCSGSADTLQCLRDADYKTFLNAANSVPGLLSFTSVSLSYVPRPDGKVLPDSPEVLAAKGQYAAVPMIIGDQEDEGTLFALFQPNITTTDRLIDYLKDIFFHNANRDQMATLVGTYDESITAGSPFNTGIFNNIYPQFKRLAAILGDFTFTLNRRAFLQLAQDVNPTVPSWSYLSSYDFGTPILGTFHGSDLLQVFYGLLPNFASKAIHTYYINFLYNLDPNVGGGDLAEWPLWRDNKQLVQFWSSKSNLLADDFRSDSFDFIAKNIASLRL